MSISGNIAMSGEKSLDPTASAIKQEVKKEI